MTATPVTDLSVPQNVGYTETDPNPIIHSVRWRHLTSRYIFTDVADVTTYHQDGSLIIDLATHSVSYLDVYLLRNVVLTQMKVYLRFMRDTDNVLIEEPYLIGEGGSTIAVANDPVNADLSIVKGIAFTESDLGDGTPMYDFQSMSNEGVYEVWLKAVTDTGNELHVRVPFQWATVAEPALPTTEPTEPSPTGDQSPVEGDHLGYDEYYVSIIEGDSPFTKRPSTHFRMAGVGLLKEPHCFVRQATPIAPPISKPADVIGVYEPPAPCALAVEPTSKDALVGDTVVFTLEHINTSGILDIQAAFDSKALSEDLSGNGTFKTLKAGTATIGFTVIYENGQECTVTATVVVTEPITVTPAPNTLYCGADSVATGANGFGEYIHSVDEVGTYYIVYDFLGAPDRMYLWIGEVLVHDTGSVVESTGSPISFNYAPADGELKVVMNDGSTGSQWEYTMYCPSNVPADVKTAATPITQT